MDFSLYRRLKRLATESPSFGDFVNGVSKSTFFYGVPLWSKVDYEWFYNKISNGNVTYEKLFK